MSCKETQRLNLFCNVSVGITNAVNHKNLIQKK
jgi:hypothetical protein